jgi:hypothetical protein
MRAHHEIQVNRADGPEADLLKGFKQPTPDELAFFGLSNVVPAEFEPLREP